MRMSRLPLNFYFARTKRIIENTRQTGSTKVAREIGANERYTENLRGASQGFWGGSEQRILEQKEKKWKYFNNDFKWWLVKENY